MALFQSKIQPPRSKFNDTTEFHRHSSCEADNRSLSAADPETLPRHPNFIWEQLAADELYASFIVDGHHLPAATVKSMVRAKTPARTILVTDAMAAAGCAPGSYVIGELAVELSAEGRVSEPGAAHLAGSALSMQNAVANTVCFTGLSLEEVLPMASTQPARYLGLETAGRGVAEWDQSDCRLSVVQVTTGEG